MRFLEKDFSQEVRNVLNKQKVRRFDSPIGVILISH